MGIIHRDVKPENVLLLNSKSTETVKLIDFGTSIEVKLKNGEKISE